MKDLSEDLYNRYHKHNITFNQDVIKSLGLVLGSVVIKCGDIKVPCIIYSSTLIGSRIIINLTEEYLNYVRRKKGVVSLYYIFKNSRQKGEISFYVSSKITHIEYYNETKKDFYYCNLEFVNKAPKDLINILGEYVDRQENMYKRAEERFIINTKNGYFSKKKALKNYIFIDGVAKRCILAEISLFSAKLILVVPKKDLKEKISAMLIIKLLDLEGTGEMLGKIERVELINEEENLFSIILKFDQDMIPPSYKMWIAEFLEIVSSKS